MVELRIALLRSGMTQLALARKCGLSYSVLNAIIRELRPPRPEERSAIAVALERDELTLFPAPAPIGQAA